MKTLDDVIEQVLINLLTFSLIICLSPCFSVPHFIDNVQKTVYYRFLYPFLRFFFQCWAFRVKSNPSATLPLLLSLKAVINRCYKKGEGMFFNWMINKAFFFADAYNEKKVSLFRLNCCRESRTNRSKRMFEQKFVQSNYKLIIFLVLETIKKYNEFSLII